MTYPALHYGAHFYGSRWFYKEIDGRGLPIRSERDGRRVGGFPCRYTPGHASPGFRGDQGGAMQDLKSQESRRGEVGKSVVWRRSVRHPGWLRENLTSARRGSGSGGWRIRISWCSAWFLVLFSVVCAWNRTTCDSRRSFNLGTLNGDLDLRSGGLEERNAGLD